MAGDAIRVEVRGPNDLRDGLNREGLGGGRIDEACLLRQGHSPTMTGTILLYGLVKLLLPGTGAFSRTFVLAAAADRVTAHRARGAVVDRELYRATVNVEVEASFPRTEVRAETAPAGITPNAVLSLPIDGKPTRVPISVPNSKLEGDLDVLVEALGA